MLVRVKTIEFSNGIGPKSRPFTLLEKRFVLSIINNLNSWPGLHWIVFTGQGKSDWIVSLENSYFISTELDPLAHSSNETSFKNLSVTMPTYNGNQKITWFNLTNWNHVPAPLHSRYSIVDYRTYLINHELGHALGLDHPTIKQLEKLGQTTKCPIMVQQTKGLLKFQKNIWPLVQEKQKFVRRGLT